MLGWRRNLTVMRLNEPFARGPGAFPYLGRMALCDALDHVSIRDQPSRFRINVG